MVAAADGPLGTFRGALVAAPHVSFESLRADTVGEVEGKVLVIKRVKQKTFHLGANESDRETIERVFGVYADSCPVVRSVKDSIEITSKLDLTTG